MPSLITHQPFIKQGLIHAIKTNYIIYIGLRLPLCYLHATNLFITSEVRLNGNTYM